MEKDPILEELHRIREKYAARFNFDLKAIYRDLKAREKRGEFVVVHRSPRPRTVKLVKKRRGAGGGAA